MRRYPRTSLALAALALSFAGVGRAADVPVMTGAAATRLGGEFRSELIYDNQGLYKHAGYNPAATSSFQVSDVNILLSGYVNAETEYSFRFNLLNPVAGPLDFGYGTHWFSDVIGFSIGKERLLQGGWDHLEQGYRTQVQGVYAQNLALSDYDYMVALHWKIAGLATLQVVNDVVQDSTDPTNIAASHRYNKNKHPTWVVGWLGDLGPIKPLVDFGSYDNNKSHWVDVGVKTLIDGLEATLDFHQDSEAYLIETGTPPNTLGHREADDKASYTAHVSYEFKGLITPWVYYSYYKNNQASDSAVGLSDADYNLAVASPSTPGGYTYVWNNNGRTYGFGADFNTFGQNWNPFIAYVANTGTFLKYGSTMDTEQRTDSQVKVGVLGQI